MKVTLALILAVVLLSAIPGEATTAILLDDVNLVQQSTAVVIGWVTDIKSYADPADGRIWTLVGLHVEEALKGPLAPGPMTIRQPGGRVAALGSWVLGAPRFTRGEKTLLFLDQHRDGALRVLHLFQGKFSVVGDLDTGDQFAYRDHQPEGVRILAPPARGIAAPPTFDIYRLDDLRAHVTALAAGAPPPRRPVRPDAGLPPGAVAQSSEYVGQFTFIESTRVRWFEPDSGGAVTVQIDERGAAENVGPSITAARQGLAAWTNVPGSSFRYADGGFTPAPSPGGFRADGVNGIWFRDPDNDISDPVNCQGTLAIGGLSSVSSSQTKVVNGLSFTRALEGDLVLNNGWTGCGFFEDATTLAEIIAHELGHVLGLGHSADSDATMATTLHADGRGASLRSDDVAGLVFIYPDTFRLTAIKAGTGNGAVTSAPAGIDCGSDCAEIYGAGTVVGLTATTAAGSFFAGWSGGGCSGTGACTVTLTADTSVTATFSRAPGLTSPFTLTVIKAGAGGGTVASAPTGINCGGDCSEAYTSGTVVTLTATAATGSLFAGWSGGGCSGTGACTVAPAADTSVTATFVVNVGRASLVASVLPSSRSVTVGTPVTAFATIINTGPDTALVCGIAPSTSLPATFVFQTTDPATNQLTGTLNAAVDIPAGAAQSFMFALTPTSPVAATEVMLTFDCGNSDPATVMPGVNTLLFSASAQPSPDVVALAATLTSDGIVNIPGATGTGIFSVATVNVGAASPITASTDTGGTVLPVTVTLCQTNPQTGQCLSAIVPAVPTAIAANETPTFAVFVQGTGPVSFDPANHRVFVRFTDGAGITRGATSIAVRTQ